MMCPKCKRQMRAPRPLADGLPGILYWECNQCGYVRPVTKRVPRERLDTKEVKR